MSKDTVVIGEVPLSSFSGEGPRELIGDAKGQVFVSPAYDEPRSGNSIDLDSLEVRVTSSDPYVCPDRVVNPRPFLMGPPPTAPTARFFPPHVSDPDYLPTLNNPYFALASTKPQVKGVMTEVPSGNQTVILY